ncbi:MAG: PilW family protein [Burkholderiales bacterium]|nr:PilW family protein [Burkholderiales bacterium]
MTKTVLHRQRGFTLIELMVGMVIGMVIVIALIMLLVNVNRNNTELAKANRLIENGRLALQLVSSDIQHAGFLAGHVPNFDDLTNAAAPTLANAGGQAPTAIPDPCTAFSTSAWTHEYKSNLLGIPVVAYPIPSGTSPTSPVCTSIVTSPKASTDVLVVRHVEPCVATSTGSSECFNDSATSNPNVYFQPSRCTTDSATYGTGTFVLSRDTFSLRQRDCATTAPLYRYASTLYYVRTYATTSGDNLPTLMRSQFKASGTDAPTHLAADALIEGVEAMVVEFGLDNTSDSGAAVNLLASIAWADSTTLTSPTNRGDGNADSYVRCTSYSSNPCDLSVYGSTVPAIVNAVTVKVHLLMRSEAITTGHTDTKTYTLGSTTYGPFNDNYKRHVFSQTIRLTNVSGRRETP